MDVVSCPLESKVDYSRIATKLALRRKNCIVLFTLSVNVIPIYVCQILLLGKSQQT
jgi:hypothetical protein